VTSKEIRALLDVHPAHPEFWLAEIAYQFAVHNEKEEFEGRIDALCEILGAIVKKSNQMGVVDLARKALEAEGRGDLCDYEPSRD
jgi:hypothetical protein